ncbi:hypothetical protein [Streptomyces sp. NPDC060187]
MPSRAAGGSASAMAAMTFPVIIAAPAARKVPAAMSASCWTPVRTDR